MATTRHLSLSQCAPKGLIPFLAAGLLATIPQLSTTALAQAQLNVETLIGDAVGSPNDSRYSDVAEAIKRYANNDALGARQFLETAKRKNPTIPPVELMMAKMYLLRGQTQAGLQALETTVREVPGDPEPFLLLADQAIASNQAIQAIALYDKAINLIDDYDDNARRKRKFIIRARAGRSAVHQRWQNWEAAEADLRAWLEADPEDANAYNRLGAVLFMLGQEREGYDAFVKAKELNDDLPSPYVSAASLYQRLAAEADEDAKEREYQAKAKQSFERAYQSNPSDVTTVVSYADWLIKQGDLETADKVLAQGRQAAPDAFQVFLLSGVLAQMKNNPADAINFYNQTLAIAPGNRDAYNQLAMVLIGSDDSKDRQRAEQIARMNAQLNENNADVNITLAWVLRQQGKGAEATQAYQKGIRLGTLSADSSLLVAKLLVEQNRGDVARTLLENALEREQGIFVNRAEAEALLETLK